MVVLLQVRHDAHQFLYGRSKAQTLNRASIAAKRTGHKSVRGARRHRLPGGCSRSLT